MQPSPNEQSGPTPHEAPAGLREAFVVIGLLILTAILLPAWGESGTVYVPDFLGQMFSPWLLPALGLLWVVRCGSVDLSVWVGFGIGSSAAGAIALAGGHFSEALAVAAGAGAALGAVNAAGVAWARLPGWGVTGVTAILGASAASVMAAGLPGRLDGAVFGWWSGAVGPLVSVGSLYVIALLLALIAVRPSPRARPSRRAALAAAMLASGVLSALGGACWLAKSAQLPSGLHVIGDLRLAAGVVLTGAAVLKGPWRSLLSAMLLPPAMLVATVWRQRVWDVPELSFSVNVLVLTVMMLGAQWAGALAGEAPAARIRQRAGVAMFLGVIVLAATGRDLPRPAENILHVVGAGLWLAGAGIIVFRRVQRRGVSGGF